MLSDKIDTLYADYLADNTRLDPLLEAVRLLAVKMLRDEDESQEFILWLWESLPTIAPEIEDGKFASYLMRHLRYRHLAAGRKLRRQAKHLTPLDVIDADGDFILNPVVAEQLIDDKDPIQKAEEQEALEQSINRFDSIDDPFVRKVIDLIYPKPIRGADNPGLKSLKAVAEHLGMTPTALRKRLQRYRDKLTDNPDDVEQLAA